MTATCPLPHLDLDSESIHGLKSNQAGHLLLSIGNEVVSDELSNLTRLEQYSLRNVFSQQACWMNPIITKLAIPPDTFVTGDQALLHKDTSNTPGGNLPLVLLLHPDIKVFDDGTN